MANWYLLDANAVVQTATVVAGSGGGNVDALFPASNAGAWREPMLVTRDTNGTLLTVALDFGSATPISHIVLLNTNATLALAASEATVGGADETSGIFAIGQNHRTGRGAKWLPVSTVFTGAPASLNRRYFSIALSSPLMYGTRVELGAILALYNPSPLLRNPAWPSYTIDRAVELIETRSGAVQRNIEGPPFLRFRIGQANWWRTHSVDDDGLDEIMAVARAARSGPLLMYENRGIDSDVFLVTDEGATSFAENRGGVSFGAEFALREVIG